MPLSSLPFTLDIIEGPAAMLYNTPPLLHILYKHSQTDQAHHYRLPCEQDVEMKKMKKLNCKKEVGCALSIPGIRQTKL